MKNRLFMLCIVGIFLLSLSACSLPSASQEQPKIADTPDATYEALKALATLLTPEPATPVPADTVTPIPADTETPVPTETPIPTETSTLTSVPTETSTALPTETLTSTPTLTPVAPIVVQPYPGQQFPYGYNLQRTNHPFLATYMDDKPTIDGPWTEWDSPAYPASNVVYGEYFWAGENDLDGSFRIGWDYNYLYIAVKVKDDYYVQNATGAEIYKGDSLEILLDTDLYNDFYIAQLDTDDYQLGISPGNPDTSGTREAFLWYPNNISGSLSDVNMASTQSDGVYRVEAAIPWSTFGVTPQPGLHLGFSLSVSDNDRYGQKIQQSVVSSAPKRRLTNPTSWGELILGY